MINVYLPFPPTLNHYWIRQRKGYRISERGQSFRIAARLAYRGKRRFLGPVCVVLGFTQPDKRKRDLDNLGKAVLDALTHAGAWDDDSQVHSLTMFWSTEKTPGTAVTITEIP